MQNDCWDGELWPAFQTFVDAWNIPDYKIFGPSPQPGLDYNLERGCANAEIKEHTTQLFRKQEHGRDKNNLYKKSATYGKLK